MNITDSKTFRTVVIITFICGSLFLLAGALSAFSSLAQTPDISNIPTISVSGTGDAVAIPDAAEFSFSVTKNAATVSAAQSAATMLTNSAIAALKTGGVADKDIKTTDYSINPHYTYATTPTNCPYNGCAPVQQIPDGYEVSQSIDVTVETASSTGQLLQALGSLGITNIGSITFTESDKDAVTDQARTAAIADAQSKAKTLASQLGVTLGSIVNFQESNSSPYPIMYAAGAMNSSAASVPAPSVPTGQNKITDNVTITYQIR